MPQSAQGAPRNNRIPRVNVETRLRIENPVAETGDLLMIAPKLASAGGVAGDIYTIANEREATRIFGSGSIGYRMFRAWQAQAPFQGVRMLVLDDAGTARTAEIDFTGTVTTGGVISVTVGSDVIQTAVDVGDTNEAVATKVAAAITAYPIPLQFTATAASGTVTLTARNGGVVNNSVGFDVDVGDVGGTTGVVDAAAGTMGAGDYPYASLEAAVGDDLFDLIVPCDLGVTPSLVQALLTNRWNANSALFGVELQVVKGTLTTLENTYANQDLPYRAYLGVNNGNPSPTYEIAAAAGQRIYARYARDPVLSYNNIPLSGIGAPKLSARFNEAGRQSLLEGRIGTVKYTKDGTCLLESLPLAWTPSGGGFYYLSNLFTLMYIGRIFADLLGQYISNFKFADIEESTAIPPGAVSIQTIRADCIAQYGTEVALGRAEDIDSFTRNLRITRPANKPGTLEVVLPVNIANAVREINIVNSWEQ